MTGPPPAGAISPVEYVIVALSTKACIAEAILLLMFCICVVCSAVAAPKFAKNADCSAELRLVVFSAILIS